MAVAKGAEPKSNAGLVAVAAIVLAIAFTVGHGPGLLLLWVGLLVATTQTMPPSLTGQKDGRGEPTAQGAEVAKLAAYRRWLEWRPALLPAASWWPWPVSRSVLAAFGVACLAYALPVDMTVALRLARDVLADAVPGIPDRIDAEWLRIANAACGYVLVVAAGRVRRAFASEEQAAPPVPITDAWSVIKGKPGWYVTVAVLGATVVGAAVFFGAVAARTILDPGAAWVAAGGVLLLGSAGLLHMVAAEATLTPWRQTVEASAWWSQRWQAMQDQRKLTPRPALVDHRRLGDDGEMWIDVIELPSSLGPAPEFVQKPLDLLHTLVGDRTVALCSTEDVIADAPVPGSRHPRRMAAISWPAGWQPSLDAPDLDPDVGSAWVKAALRRATAKGTGLLPEMFLALHDGEQEGPPVWGVSLANPDPAMNMQLQRANAVGLLEQELGAPTYWSGNDDFVDLLFIGEVSERAHWSDPSLLQRIEHDRTITRWMSDHWQPVVKMNASVPYAQPGHAKSAAIGGLTVSVMPHAVPKGGDAQRDYVSTVDPAALTTTFEGSQAAVIALRREGATARPSDRFFDVIWVTGSGTLDHLTPSALRPSRVGSDAVGLAMKLTVTRAFQASRLMPPLVLDQEALTKPESRGHLWKILVRLNDRDTIADLRQTKVTEQLRKALAADYFRIQEDGDGRTVSIIAGADPASGRVLLADDRATVSLLSMDLEEAFTVAKIRSDSGRVPTLVDHSRLERNDEVERVELQLPAGVTVSDFGGAKTGEELQGALRREFVQVRPGERPDQVVMLLSERSPLPFPAPFDWDFIAATDAKTVPFASGITGEPVVFDRTDEYHLLIVGGTGSGKSATAFAILAADLMHGNDVVVLDAVKGAADFVPLDPWLLARASNWDEAAVVTRRVLQELKRRMTLNATYGVGSADQLPEDVRPTPMIVFVDEFTSALMVGKPPKLSDSADEDQIEEHTAASQAYEASQLMAGMVGRIVREARSALIFLILAGQKLDAKTLDAMPGGSTLKPSMSRLAIGKLEYPDYVSILGQSGADQVPVMGAMVPKGRGVFKSNSGVVQLLQSWFDTDNVASVVTHITGARAPLEDGVRFDVAGELARAQAERPRALGAVLEEAAAVSVIEEADPVVDVADLEVIDLGIDLDDLDFETVDPEADVLDLDSLIDELEPAPGPVVISFDDDDDDDDDDDARAPIVSLTFDDPPASAATPAMPTTAAASSFDDLFATPEPKPKHPTAQPRLDDAALGDLF